jgi:hypothetical protein
MDSERHGEAAIGLEMREQPETLLTRTHTQTPRYAPARIPHGVPMGGPASRPPAPVHVLRQIL